MENKIVAWYMPDKGCISFTDKEEAYFMNDKVKAFVGDKISKKGGEHVQVEFEKDATGDLIISKIVLGAEAPKTETKTEAKAEPKKEEPSSSQTEVKDEETREVTVGGVSLKNNAENPKKYPFCGITFQEDNTDDNSKAVWYDITPEEVKAKDIKRGLRVKITSSTQKDKKNRLITSIFVVEASKETKKEEPKSGSEEKQTAPKSRNNDVQLSIEAQASVNSANHTVSTLFAGKIDINSPDDCTKIKTAIKAVAEANFDLIQTLKNRG